MPCISIGITDNPAMGGVIESLGGHISQDYRVLKLANNEMALEEMGYRREDFLGETTLSYVQDGRYKRPSRLMVIDIGVMHQGLFNAGFSLLCEDSYYCNGAIAIIVPERRVDTIDRPSLSPDRLLGQVFVLLNPALTKQQLDKYEYDIAKLVVSHKWHAILQRKSAQEKYNGQFLETWEGQNVHELQIN